MRTLTKIGTAAMLAIALPTAANAQQRSFNLPAQSATKSIPEFARQAGIQIVAPGSRLRKIRTRAIIGQQDVRAALRLLIEGTGLRIVADDGSTITLGVAPGTPTPTPTPTAQSSALVGDAEGKEPVGDIVVTGTRISGSGPIGSKVVTIDRNDIERSGYSTTQQVLAALPQNFNGGPNEGTVGFSIRNNTGANFGFGSGINLRGLGAGSTLTLVDGNRPALGGVSGTFVDLTLIPTIAIERIEVLADGASAIYGSDAVAGVVNVRLRRDFEGAATTFRYGTADGFDEVQANQLIGAHWQSGHLVIGYEYYRRGRLGADDRSYVTEDLRPFGGPDYRQSFASPATIIAADGRVFGVPRGQDGRNLQPGDLSAGMPNLADGRAGTDVLPRLERHSAFLTLDQDLSDWLKFRGEAFYANRNSSTRYFPGGSPVSVTSANPYYVDPIGTGQPVTVFYDFRPDLGSPTLNAYVKNWSTSAALEARFGGWSAEVRGAYGEQREREHAINFPNYARLDRTLSDPDPATAFNLFGDGSNTSPITIDQIRGGYELSGQSRQWSTALKIDGPLTTLPGGDLKVAFGTEYRHESYNAHSIDDQYSIAPLDTGSAGFPLGRSIIAGYAELAAPVVGPARNVPGIYSLDVSIAGRIERYSDVGTTANPKVGLRWRPVSPLSLRVTYGTSFRAPSFTDIRRGPGLNQIVPFPLLDAASPSGTTFAIALFGNRPDIRPEKATTWSAGFDLRPDRLPGLTVSATYFNIQYRDRISNPAADVFSFLSQTDRFGSLITRNPGAALVASLYADQTFINPYGVPASAVGAIVDARNANLARSRVAGIDFDLGFRGKATAAFGFEFGVSGTYLFHETQQLTPGGPEVDVLSTIGNPIDLRLRGRAAITRGALSGAAFVNYSDGYLNNGVAAVEPVASFTTVDLQLGYEFDASSGPMKGVKLSLSINNLFDRGPPYVNNRTPYSASGFDPEQASPVGRLIAFQVGKTW